MLPPAAEWQGAAGRGQPAAGSRQAASSRQQGAGSRQQSAVGSWQPAADGRQPAKAAAAAASAAAEVAAAAEAAAATVLQMPQASPCHCLCNSQSLCKFGFAQPNCFTSISCDPCFKPTSSRETPIQDMCNTSV